MKMAIGGWLLWGLLGTAGSVWAQNATVGAIYTCVDAQGRKLTSDRPISECLDREQKVLNPSGTVAQKVGPSLTAAERAQQEARDKQEQEARSRVSEERRRDKALLIRFPTRAAHDKERADAIEQVAAISAAASRRLVELAAQRKKLDDEMEFYSKNPAKAPLYLRRQVEENTQNVEAQNRFILDQEEETKRINSRFDAELVRLRQLWPDTTNR
jgi:Domain of unknown function (DUF4124)